MSENGESNPNFKDLVESMASKKEETGMLKQKTVETKPVSSVETGQKAWEDLTKKTDQPSPLKARVQ